MIKLRAGSCTDVGRVRQINEDNLLVSEDEGIFAVADGVGGHAAGEVASLIAVRALKTAFTEPRLDCLVQAVEKANQAVWAKAQARSQLRGMGTTLTAVALVKERGEERLALVNVGDSRAYLLHEGDLSRLTEDHSLVEEMVREGRLSPEEAEVHPQRSVITRALGLDADVEVDNWQFAPLPGARILLCSDGLTNEVGEDRIAATLRRLADPQEAANDLVEQAKAHGGNDNITVVIVDVVEFSEDHDGKGRTELTTSGVPVARATPGAPKGGTAYSYQSNPTGAQAATVTPPPQKNFPQPPRPPRSRRLTWRVTVFSLLVLLVLGGAAGAVGWFARRTFYVGFDGGEVAIFRGRPGGLLWFDPTLERSTDLTRADVPQEHLDDVETGKEMASLTAARRYVARLERGAQRTPGGGDPLFPTTTITSTTLPPFTTTTPTFTATMIALATLAGRQR